MGIIKKELFDANASLYVLSVLMHKPLLLQQEKYNLTTSDFNPHHLHELVFGAIYNLAQVGVEKITSTDIDLQIKQSETAYNYYEKNQGYEWVLSCFQLTEQSDDKQFDLYYNRLKKFSVLRDLERAGINTNQFYDPDKDILNKDAEDLRLNNETVTGILNTLRTDLAEIENKHIGKDNGNAQIASTSLRNLVQHLKEVPEVGLPIDGEIINWATRGAREGKMYIYSAPSGGGKALPNNTLIPMADGSFKTVGEVKIGDMLIDRHGNPTQVLKIFPQGKKDVYQVTFKDGRVALCNNEHLWTYHNTCSRDPLKLETKTLQELIDIINEKGIKTDKSWRFSVPFNDPVNYPTQEYKLEPYLLGLLIGDGSFREQSTNRNLIFSDGIEELVKNFKILGWSYHRCSENNYSYSFKDKNGKNIHVTEFCNQYDLQELCNKYSFEKTIPEKYMIGDVQQRLALLQGLLDTDGSVESEKGRISFCNTSLHLCEQVQTLCYSLGLTATIKIDDKRKDKYTTGICYNVHISGNALMKSKLFRLNYKQERINKWLNNGKRKESFMFNAIVDIKKLNDTTEMTCFLVDNPEHLFLMNDYIVTHNTRFMVGNACAISLPYLDAHGDIIMRQDYRRVLFVATEMQADEIQTLILAYVSGVNEKSILLGRYTPQEEERINRALDIIDKYGKNFIIECIPDPSINLIKARLTKYIIQDNIEYIFYDYIFSSPGLLSEFRDVAVREDVALMMLSNTLKEIAMTYNIFIQSATQLNDGWSKKEIGLRDQNCIRGSKAIADKVDIGMIGVRLGEEERKQIKGIWQEVQLKNHYTHTPNIVVDIYKNRRGEMNCVKVFRYFDYATCRCEDLFVTDANYKGIDCLGEFKCDTKSINYYDFLDLKVEGA